MNTLLPPLLGAFGLAAAFVIYLLVMKYPDGEDKVKKIGDQIHKGALTFMKTEYTYLLGFIAVLFVLVFLALGVKTAIALLVGAACSATAGFIGMYAATKANVRTATAAQKEGAAAALSVSFYGGSIMGLCVASLGLLGLGILFHFFSGSSDAAHSIEGFGMGASVVALFSRVGGGIFTKSADVGADLVGKVEAGIPEDDPRNPGVIADNVGDAVGDCAGRGADLFESISGETIGAMIVGLIFYLATVEAGLEEGYAIGFIIFPLVARGLSMLATLVTLPIVKLDDSGMKTEKDEQGNEIISFDDNPMRPMNNAFYAVSAISFAIFAILILFMLGNGDFGVFWPLIASAAVGIVLALLTLWVTDYYTGDNKPVLSIAESSLTGPATNIITGLSVGLMSTWAPMLSLIGAIVISYILGIPVRKPLIFLAQHFLVQRCGCNLFVVFRHNPAM